MCQGVCGAAWTRGGAGSGRHLPNPHGCAQGSGGQAGGAEGHLRPAHHSAVDCVRRDEKRRRPNRTADDTIE